MVRVIYWTCFAIKRDCLITDATNSESTRPLIPPSRGQIPRNQGFTRSSLFFFYHRLKISTILHISIFKKKSPIWNYFLSYKSFPFMERKIIWIIQNYVTRLRVPTFDSLFIRFEERFAIKLGDGLKLTISGKLAQWEKKTEEGFLQDYRCTIFARSLLRFVGSVSGWSVLAQWASRSLMGWKFDRLGGGHFPLVPANWLRSKLVIDWQHVPGRGQYTRVATRREPYWPTLVVPDVGTVYIFTATSRFIRYSPALFPWNGIASRVGEWYIRPLVSYPKLRLDINIQFFLLTRPFHRPSFSNFFLRIFETNFRPREKI